MRPSRASFLRRTKPRPSSVVTTPVAVGRLMPTAAANSRVSISPQIHSTHRPVNAVHDSRSVREDVRFHMPADRRRGPEQVRDGPHRPEVERSRCPSAARAPSPPPAGALVGSSTSLAFTPRSPAIRSPSSRATSTIASTSSSVVRKFTKHGRSHTCRRSARTPGTRGRPRWIAFASASLCASGRDARWGVADRHDRELRRLAHRLEVLGLGRDAVEQVRLARGCGRSPRGTAARRAPGTRARASAPGTAASTRA